MKYDHFSEGQIFITDSVIVDKDELIHFANNYDPQYFHTSEEAAKESIFGQIIAPGAFTLSLLWKEWVQLNILGRDCIAGIGIDHLRFHNPVFPNDILHSEVTVHKCIPVEDPTKGIIHLQFVGKNQSEKNVLSCIFKLLIKR